jgi:hypothetical protein
VPPTGNTAAHFSFAALLLTAAAFQARFWTNLTFRRAKVINVGNAQEFSTKLPTGMVCQNKDSHAVRQFRSAMPSLSDAPLSIERAIQIRRWVRSLQSDSRAQWVPVNDSGVTDPSALRQELAQQHPGACRRLAYVAAAALIADGYHARVVGAVTGIDTRAKGHTMTEVWVPEFRKWVLLDATFDVTYMIRGTPASLLDVHCLLRDQREDELTIDDCGVQGWPRIGDQRQFVALFRHIFALQTMDIFERRDGTSFMPSRRLVFNHLSNGLNQPYPSPKKALMVGSTLCTFLAFLFWVVIAFM